MSKQIKTHSISRGEIVSPSNLPEIGDEIVYFQDGDIERHGSPWIREVVDIKEDKLIFEHGLSEIFAHCYHPIYNND